MTTSNTPAPGTPEWLRREADGNDALARNLSEAFGEPAPSSYTEHSAGLRAAAERIEQLEGECATWRDAYHALRVAHSKEIAENGVLHAELLKNDRLRAENEALKRERDNYKRTLDVTQACLGSAIMTVGDLAIDPARKEGA